MMYKYLIYENDKLIDEGNSKELAEKYQISCISGYANASTLMLGKYKVYKIPQTYYPKENEEYYYYSLYGGIVCKSYWNSKKGECIINHKIGNVYKKREQAQEYGKRILEDLQYKFLKERMQCLV